MKSFFMRRTREAVEENWRSCHQILILLLESLLKAISLWRKGRAPPNGIRGGRRGRESSSSVTTARRTSAVPRVLLILVALDATVLITADEAGGAALPFNINSLKGITRNREFGVPAPAPAPATGRDRRALWRTASAAAG
ncbi:hypothetical protein EVAR_92611_1 [Eumeta japonica]|uniref:Uncharacterized protein n=1 Tax=Eumeta variegata TaxID=151549 RepID=A0A4C1SWS8_EUMVA|nr:hypothetical protein EVAR_92611_1 [Eumeta japonica]